MTGAPRRSAVLVYAVALTAYVAAVFHRSSLGVTGVDAADRFHINASALAIFSVAQLAVYAAMQVPVGVLLDRFGSRRLLLTGGALMVAGQLCFAVATDVRLAVAARVLVGLGDAMTFISVLRIVAFWFPGRRNPLLVQLTGTVGQLGAVPRRRTPGGAAAPRRAGRPPSSPRQRSARPRCCWCSWRCATRRTPSTPPPPPRTWPPYAGSSPRPGPQPGTRLGLWTHFVTQFSGTVFALLWGYPFLVQGQGLSPTAAASAAHR